MIFELLDFYRNFDKLRIDKHVFLSPNGGVPCHDIELYICHMPKCTSLQNVTIQKPRNCKCDISTTDTRSDVICNAFCG